MLHFGDITKISGFDAPVVDVVVGGSPCQDLSIAGKRAGLDGERSGLFMEQIRIIKEMRENDRRNGRTDDDVRPRYMVWENVPGAFSSHKGEDFRIVLEETAKVADKDAVVPMPDKGKWSNSGCVMGEGWSIAWRILDAQFWGVPQRRRRIALVADFGGQSAPEILFVSKSMSGNTEPSEQTRKETSCNASRGIGADDREGTQSIALDGGGNDEDSKGCLRDWQGGNRERGYRSVYSAGYDEHNGGVNCLTPWDTQTRRCYGVDGIAPSLCSGERSGQNQQSFCIPYTLKIRSGCEGGGKGALIQTDKSATLSTLQDQTLFQPVCYSVDKGGGKSQANVQEGKAPTLTCTHGGEPAVCYAIGNGHINQAYLQEKVGALNCMHDQQSILYQSTVGSLCARDFKGVGSQYVDEGKLVVSAVDARNGTESETNGALQSNSAHSLNGNNVVRVRYIVRRLTPMECERLQGFPDGWTDIGEYTDTNGKKKKTSDSARYKALGNSIAIPPWKWVMKRISACYERDATLASLFDGIGGFPYIWEQINGKGTCLWASEIEEFCIAVTKERIG